MSNWNRYKCLHLGPKFMIMLSICIYFKIWKKTQTLLVQSIWKFLLFFFPLCGNNLMYSPGWPWTHSPITASQDVPTLLVKIKFQSNFRQWKYCKNSQTFTQIPQIINPSLCLFCYFGHALLSLNLCSIFKKFHIIIAQVWGLPTLFNHNHLSCNTPFSGLGCNFECLPWVLWSFFFFF